MKMHRPGYIVIARDDSPASGGTGRYIGSRKVFRTLEAAQDWASGVHPDREPLVVEFPIGCQMYDYPEYEEVGGCLTDDL
jgi:hypothetical protein